MYPTGHDAGRKRDITTPRFELYNNMAKEIAREAGFMIADIVSPTRTRFDSTWDGVHYSIAGAGSWKGPASFMMEQIVLNMIFDDCIGNPAVHGSQ